MGMEIEWKYQATPEILGKIVGSLPGKFEIFRMKTVYFDTPDRLLSAEKITLRIRRENNASIATVKSPKQGLGRGEWECAGDNMAQVLPVLAKESGLPALNGLKSEDLSPICGAEFTRRAMRLAVPGGEVELALDLGKVTGSGREAPICEVEIEGKTSQPAGEIQWPVGQKSWPAEPADQRSWFSHVQTVSQRYNSRIRSRTDCRR